MILQHIICSKCGESMENVGTYGDEEYIWRCMECGNYSYVKEGEEIMTNNEEWCIHTIFQNGEWYLKRKHGLALMEDDWDICPIKGCRIKRPEEPKPLWQSISGGGVSSSDSQEAVDNLHKAFSLSAIEWFEKKLPDTISLNPGDEPEFCRGQMSYINLVKALLDKEKERCK